MAELEEEDSEDERVWVTLAKRVRALELRRQGSEAAARSLARSLAVTRQSL